MKPFYVTSGKLKLKFIPDDVGYGVVGVGIRGLNTQGDTFEEALANAQDAAKELAKLRMDMKRMARRGKSGAPAVS